MRRIGKFIGISVTILLTALYILSCFTPYVSPLNVPFFTLLSIVYLPILCLYSLMIIVWFFINRRLALFFILWLLVGYKNLFSTVAFNVFNTGWKEHKDSTCLRVMLWNANDFNGTYTKAEVSVLADRKAMFELINKYKPDILCLPDLFEPTAGNNFSNVNDAFNLGGFKEKFYADSLRDQQTWGLLYYGELICSKLPIKDSGMIALSEENPAGLGYIDVQLSGKPLRIFTTHLSSMALWPSEEEEAGVNFLKDSTKARMKGIVAKLQYYGQLYNKEARKVKAEIKKSPYPVLLAGDLNAVPSSHIYQILKRDMKDAFLEKDFGVGGTYNRIFPKFRIDVMLHTSEIEVIQFTRPASRLSDHYPLVADIRWKE